VTFATYAPRQPVGSGRGNITERPMPPLWLVIHTSEQGTESENSAENLCAFIATPATETNVASYHYVLDTDKVFPLVRDDYRAHAASGGNTQGLHVCFPGKAAQTPTDWHDPISAAQLEQCARWLADKSVEYDIPLFRLTPVDLIVGNRGVCGHVDVTNAFHQSTHTDPGVNFPYAEVIDRAVALRSDSPLVEGYGPWPSYENKPTLRLSEQPVGNAVLYLQLVCNDKAGQGIVEDSIYGPQTVAALNNIKSLFGLKADGICGPAAWDAVDFLATRG